MNQVFHFVDFLARTLTLAQTRQGFCAPNPSVGAVIASHGQLISEGVHQACGQPHAEVEALKKAGTKAQGATLYVSLSPCHHQGRTPPCTEAIIQAGIQKVIYGYEDPNSAVQHTHSGKLLQRAGIEYEHHPLLPINRFYAPYRHWLQTGRPWVTAKLALSLDGKIAGIGKSPVIITGSALQKQTHLGRYHSDALLTTLNTIVADDPQFNCRLIDAALKKPLYVLDARLELPRNARILKTAWPITLFHGQSVSAEKREYWTKQGISCIDVPLETSQLSWPAILNDIGKRGHIHLWVEAGGHCLESLLHQKLVNEAWFYLALKSIGNTGYPGFQAAWDFSAYTTRWSFYGSEAMAQVDLEERAT